MHSPERWLPIPGYEGLYEVSDSGRVRSLFSGRQLAVPLDRKGYPRLVLKGKSWAVHRAVMAAFSPRDDWQQLQVNHKDGNRANNCIGNLEWCTASQNILHSYAVLNRKRPVVAKRGMHHGARAVVGRCIKTGESKSFDSIESVADEGFKPGDVCACAHLHQKSHRGWMWRFADPSEEQPWAYEPKKRSGAGHQCARPVERVAKDGTVTRYGSASLAAADGFSACCISHVLHGRNTSHAGYGWRYADA